MKLRTNSLKGAIYALGLALLLLLALALLPAPVHADVESPYDLYIGGVAVTSDNYVVNSDTGTGTATFTIVDGVNTLTLNGYVYEGPGYAYTQSGGAHAGIYYNGTVPLVIQLVGDSSVTMTDTDGAFESYGLRLGWTNGAPVTIQKADGADAGTLTAAAATASLCSAGVRAMGSITVAPGATLTARGGKMTSNVQSVGLLGYSAITVRGTVNATGGESESASYGVQCYNTGLTVESGGVLNASSGTTGTYRFGVSCNNSNLTVKAGAALTAQGATQAITIGYGLSYIDDGMTVWMGEDADSTQPVTFLGTQKYAAIFDTFSYGLWVGGEEVTSAHLSGEGNVDGKEGTWTYAPSAYTLTLDTYNYAGGFFVPNSNNILAALAYVGPDDLVIELLGESSLTIDTEEKPAYSTGMYFRKTGESLTDFPLLTIHSSSGGSLTARAGTAPYQGIAESHGIFGESFDLLLDGAALEAFGGQAPNATYGKSHGLNMVSGGIEVTDSATLTAKCGEAMSNDTTAIYSASLTVASGMTIHAGDDADSAGAVESYGGEKYVRVSPPTYDLWVGGEEVTGAHLSGTGNVEGKEGTWTFTPATETAPAVLTLNGYNYSGEGYACNFNRRAALYYNGVDDLTITLVGDSSLTTVSGDTIPLYSFGMHFDGTGHSATPQLTIQSASGGSLTVEAGSAGYNSYGVSVHKFNLLLAGADVETVSGHSNTSGSFGLLTTSSTLEIGSGASLTARGGQSDYEDSIGVSTEGAILVSGGTLDAKGGQAGDGEQSIGIKSILIEKTGPSISVTGGVLIAEGDQAIKLEDYASLSAPGMTIRAGESETQNSSIAASQIAEQKYVKIYKSYGLWIGGEEVTSAHLYGVGNDTAIPGRWDFDPDSYTLTLDAYHYAGEGYYYTDYDTDYDRDVDCAAALFYDGETPLTIELAGENSLTQVSNRALDESYGLLSWYKEKDGETALTIRNRNSAEGSLTLTAGQAENYSQGVYAYYGSLDVDGVTLNVCADKANRSYGLETDGLTITGSTVYAVAADAETASYGIQCYDLTVGSGAKVNARSGAAEDYSVGVYCLILTVEDKSNLFAYANTEPKDGGSLPAFCAGISCIVLNVSDDASDVTPLTAVTAHAGKGAVCYGIECGSLAVKDAGVMAYAGGENECRGIGCDGYGSKLKANIVGTESLVFGFCLNGKGVGIEIDQPGWLGNYLGIFDSIPMAAAMTEAEYFARLKETETPFPLVCVMRKYDVTLDANGGRIDGAETKTVGVAPHTYAYIAALDAEPVRTGYTLTGWALDAAGEQPLEDSYTVEGDTTLYALWKYSGGAGVSGGETRPPAPKAELTGKGKVTFDPKNPARGAAVTVAAAPDEGWELAGITAKDSEGKEVPLTKNADGTYTFTQGDKAVTVTAAFAEKKADDPLAAFTDLDAAAWYAEDVRWALTEGVMDGMGGGVFAPGGAVSRAMVAQVLWKLAGSPVVNYALPFTDMGSGAWYTEAVRWAASARLVQGYEDGTFRPENPVTRQELATMLYRWARTKGLGYDGDLWAFRLDFTDAAEVSDWADEAVHWMVQSGVLNGRGEGLLAPGGAAARAELAAILHRLTALTAA